MQGPDLLLMNEVVRASRVPVLASGGIASRRDLDNLADRGVSGAIIGMALYIGVLEPRLIAEEYGA
jgi:phosphoribosylformimino-5-aminoimidazole carboxamide ribotide isomerase